MNPRKANGQYAKTDEMVRFWRLVDTTGECWIWTGAASEDYGRFRADAKQVIAHRFAYERLVGPIPDGLHLDHLCRVRRCVNPAHLEPVTPGENTRRAPASVTTINASKTHCQNGHPLSGGNLMRTSAGHRNCRECRNLYIREREDRMRRERGAPVGKGHQGLKTHCPKGHEYSEENTYIRPGDGGRVCRECRRTDNRARKRALRVKENP